MHSLTRQELQKIAKVVADTRYDHSFDGRMSNSDLADYIRTNTSGYVLDDERIEMEIKLPATTTRVVSITGNKRGRKPRT